MCSLCAAFGQGPAWEQGGIAGQRARSQMHLEAAATADTLTSLFFKCRIKVRVNPRFGYLVDFPTGGTEIVPSLAQFWHLLQRRGIAIPDPLAQ